MSDDVYPRLPVMLNLAGRRCVVVGGGATAVRRCRSLLECGAQVTVVAPQCDPALAGLPVRWVERPYEDGDLRGAALVVVATDDPLMNVLIAEEAAARGVLVNRADEPNAGDFTVMAHARRQTLTLAVDSGGASASAAAAIRDAMLDQLDPDWITLLQEAAPMRQKIQGLGLAARERQRRLRQLTDDRAMGILKDCGVAALREHLGGTAAGEDA